MRSTDPVVKIRIIPRKGNAHRPANPVGHDGYEARGVGDDGSMSRSASSVMNLVSTAEFEVIAHDVRPDMTWLFFVSFHCFDLSALERTTVLSRSGSNIQHGDVQDRSSTGSPALLFV
ncbi:hypothetical protein CISG_05190 [Coccidioides immitis RMSCC 3703]|uniref:Uncharacterized protein n=1 Tax=Coccidioides immitis RMSCC 3703 TaxID=454286 RepID=A0A0J8QWS1_COCIT|nr:hypothetical protein CISG_05190 [Coccidioides immitis RMSCC 3703]